jgi:ankyrin repeat protein
MRTIAGIKIMRNLAEVLGAMQDLPEFVGLKLTGPNDRGNFSNTPLHIAVVQGDADAVMVLLQNSADIDSRGEHGYTPLHEAVEQGHDQIAELLIRYGAKSDIPNGDGITALGLAQTVGSESVRQLLTRPER